MASFPNVIPQSNTQNGASMSSLLLGPLNEMEILAQTLFLSLSPGQVKPPPPRVDAFLACDQALAAAVNLSYKHQIKQRKIEHLKAEILELDSRWKQICIELEVEKRELEGMIEEADERLESMEQAKKGIGVSHCILKLFRPCALLASILYPELLAYAQSLSAFTSAPPNMPDLSLPGQPPPPLFFPPFPNEEKMRRGHLNAEAPLGLLGETHSVGRAPTVSPTQNLEPGINPYRHDLRGPSQFFDLDLDLNPDL
ncbi:vitamin-D-receptor interacting mediator subunit 4-domain-containing protein [Lentinula aciculospora]|uniref:Mediator of RNA polymerase II transcription subunit 4 n=1 Tax=Lentinula aciculospora TaxID=153920 RepID=A0A9W9DJN0_9AGAR|nr:vitamin-D-receptor interacting mediator subunit 4-domain-containing protein [Lentinula aciculospora]